MEGRAIRRLVRAELLSVGSEILVGETRDTNAGELARDLTGRGVKVGRIGAVPDDLAVVQEALEAALGRADLVVTTGGLGPTPDDLTREAIAAVVGEEPVVDPATETWLRERFTRRGMNFPESNLKQAWLISSSEALPNPNGSAPGWLVRVASGRVIVALPGPPREMSPMWRDEAVPRLEAIGLGAEMAARTFRLHGIGESHAAELLGEELLRAADPQVATYARSEAVDVRVSSEGSGAADRVAAAAAVVEDRLGAYVWATGETGWAEAVSAELAARGWTLGFVEMGLGGALAALLGGMEEVRRAVLVPSPGESGEGIDLMGLATEARDAAAANVGLVAWARPRGQDTGVSVAVVTPAGTRQDRRVAFLGGPTGRSRAAHAAASILLGALREAGQP